MNVSASTGNLEHIDSIVLKPLMEDDVMLFSKWLDKEYIKKWFGEKENWLNEVNERSGKYHFLKHFIVCCNDRKIGYCLYADCFFLRDLEEEAYDVSFWNNLYEDITKENHTYEVGYLIGEEEYLSKGIGKIIVRKLEEKIIEAGGKEMSSDPSEENIVSIKTLLSNGFTKVKDGFYKKRLKPLPPKIINYQLSIIN